MNMFRFRTADRRQAVRRAQPQTVFVHGNSAVAVARRRFGDERIGKEKRRLAVRQFERDRAVRARPAGTVTRKSLIPIVRASALADRNLALRESALKSKCEQAKKTKNLILHG